MADQQSQNFDETGTYDTYNQEDLARRFSHQPGGQRQYGQEANDQGHYDPAQEVQYDQHQQQHNQADGQYYDQGHDQGQYDQGGQYDDQHQQANYHHQGDGQAYEGENGDYDPNDHSTNEDYTTLPEIMFLNHFCANAHPPRDSSEEAKIESELSWEPVREWLRTHAAEEVRAGAEQRGDSAMTALHFACRNKPPVDVVDVLLSIAVDTTQWQDSFGWLPIHYACACGADTDVIKSLGEAFPESKTTVDRRGRTPLHFALGNSNPDNPVLPVVIVLLSSTGAASFADDTGMLPLHYACAYGASEEALYVLIDAYNDAITTTDRFGRTPLHFALSNAGRTAAPAAVRLLLSSHKEIVNAVGDGPLPLRVLQEFATTVRKDEVSSREAVLRCLEHMLSFNPEPTADFFTTLQSLPDWLRERAVVMPVVQLLLNEKIAQRFPTGVLLSDLFFQLLVIGFYSYTIPKTIEKLANINKVELSIDQSSMEIVYLFPLYLGATYFLIRTLVRTLSLIALKAFRVLLFDVFFWLDVFYIYVVYHWASKMKNEPDPEELERFRIGSAVSAIVIWMKLLGYLRNTYMDFSVFLGGLFYVVQRLAAFILCLFIILLMFSLMFFTIYTETDRCQKFEQPTEAERMAELQCNGELDTEPYCSRWHAFLNVFTMLIGEVDDETFKDSLFAVILFSLFMFLVVILLANVLIAIVTDSYKVIQDQRAAIVFWTNRLDFIAEMDAIANGPWKKSIKRMVGMNATSSKVTEVTFGKEFWKRLMDLYEDDVDDGTFSLEFMCYTSMRCGAALFIIPIWLIIGLLSFGTLWPPQIREAVFTSKVLKHSSIGEIEAELRKTQVKGIKQEVQILKDDIKQELAIDRTQRLQMKSLVAERKQEIQSEMKHIKRIVTMLFEQQSSM